MKSIARIASICALACLTIIGSSCGSKEHVVSHSLIQKRKYTKGHHFNFGGTKQKEKSFNHAAKLARNNPRPSARLEAKLDDKISNFIQSVQAEEKSKALASWVKPKTTADSTEKECSTIHLLNGKKISAKILEISPDKIKYKRCSMLDGPDFVLMKNVIERIVFKNGEVEEMTDIAYVRSSQEEQLSPTVEPEEKQEAILEGLSLASMITSIIGLLAFPFFLFGLTGLILGGIGLSRIKRNPEKWKGKEFAIVGIVLGSVAVLTGLLYWSFFFLVVGF